VELSADLTLGRSAYEQSITKTVSCHNPIIIVAAINTIITLSKPTRLGELLQEKKTVIIRCHTQVKKRTKEMLLPYAIIQRRSLKFREELSS